MVLLERERELADVATRAERALAGIGSMVLVGGESGVGKTSFIDAFLASLVDEPPARGATIRVMSAACDPLSTPRPLGPIRDLASRLGTRTEAALREGEYPPDIFSAAFEDLTSEPTVLVIDDLQWADQGTIDLLRFILRRLAATPLLVIGALRDDELGLSHPGRELLGDVARSPVADTVPLAPLSVAAIEVLVEDRAIDPAWLHAITSGNPFFVVEMLDHGDGDLPLTIRDAVLARTAGLGTAAWDLLHLLTAAPEAIPDQLLAFLDVSLPALRELDAAGLVRRGSRGLAFRHDLCRLAIESVIPPGASPALHRRMLDALETAGSADAAVLVHHAAAAGDVAKTVHYAEDAGRAAARAGAHTQAAQLLRLALDEGQSLPPHHRAELLQRLADEWYLIDRLDEAIAAATEALALRSEADDAVLASVGHNALSVFEWYNADRAAALAHADRSIDALHDADLTDIQAATALGHAFAIRGFLALHATDLDTAQANVARAHELARTTGDGSLSARVGIVDGARAVMAGQPDGRGQILSILAEAPPHLDEIHSSGYSNLTYLDIEQRRLDDAASLLDRSIPLMAEHELPICRVWQIGSRGRLAMMSGAWSDAVADADDVLSKSSAPLARMWPHIVRGLVALRRTGEAGSDLEHAWDLAVRYGEPIRLLPAASALAERSWLTGEPDGRLDQWVALLDQSPRTGLEWARGELAVWLWRLGAPVSGEAVAAPYAALLARQWSDAIASLQQVPLPYDAAVIAFDAAQGPAGARSALDTLDQLGADAVAAKLRHELRARGHTQIPRPRRSATRSNPLGLTARQLEVLEALSDGSTNAELAARLFVSEKTVDHHVSAILTKLAVPNRREAVRRARELGIIP